MPIVNVFRDKEGDLVVTLADKVEPGIKAFQMNGAIVSAEDAVRMLMVTPAVYLVIAAGVLAEDSGAYITELQHLLAHTVVVSENTALCRALTKA